MNHDVRFAGLKDKDLRPRRIGALAALVVLLVMFGVLALASPYLRAPGVAAAEVAAQSSAAPAPRAEPAEENAGYPRECTPPLSDSGTECIFY